MVVMAERRQESVTATVREEEEDEEEEEEDEKDEEKEGGEGGRCDCVWICWIWVNAFSPTTWRRKASVEGEAEGNHFSRGEPSEELDCTPLADVIVEAAGLRKPHFPPPLQLRLEIH